MLDKLIRAFKLADICVKYKFVHNRYLNTYMPLSMMVFFACVTGSTIGGMVIGSVMMCVYFLLALFLLPILSFIVVHMADKGNAFALDIYEEYMKLEEDYE